MEIEGNMRGFVGVGGFDKGFFIGNLVQIVCLYYFDLCLLEGKHHESE